MSGPKTQSVRVSSSKAAARESASREPDPSARSKATVGAQSDQGPARCFISQLPDELLSSVFEHVAISYERSATSLPALYSFLRTATSICRKWYTVAIRTPRLWRTVHTLGPQCRLLLERSGVVPLHLICQLEPMADFALAHLNRSELEARIQFLSIASRRDFYVYGSSPMDLFHILNAIPRHIPLREDQKFPALTDASLGPARFVEFGDLITFASCAPDLKRLRLRTTAWAWYPQTTLPQNRRRAVFPQLEELELINLGMANAEEALYFFDAPRLTRILLVLGDDEGYKQLEHPIQRTFRGTSLLDLTIDTGHITVGDIIELLASLPTVQELGLFRRPKATYKQKFTELFHCFARRAEGEFPMLPNLRTFAHYDVVVSLEDLRLLVEAREHHQPPVQELGFKEIQSAWYLDKDFKWLKKRVKIFEWSPNHVEQQ